MPRHPRARKENRFSIRLNRLFEERLVPNSNPPRPWTLTEVSEQTGIGVGYLSRARLGQIEYPGPDKIRALAAFFGVHHDYFTQDREEAAEAALVLSPEMMETLSKPRMRQILLRAVELGPDELKLLEDMMAYAESLSKRRQRMSTEDPNSATT